MFSVSGEKEIEEVSMLLFVLSRHVQQIVFNDQIRLMFFPLN